MATMIEAQGTNCSNCGKSGWVFEFTKCHEACTTVYCEVCIQKYPEAAGRLAALDAEIAAMRNAHCDDDCVLTGEQLRRNAEEQA